jgi:hypothetical protein
MKVASLFTGCGGLDLGLHQVRRGLGVNTAAVPGSPDHLAELCWFVAPNHHLSRHRRDTKSSCSVNATQERSRCVVGSTRTRSLLSAAAAALASDAAAAKAGTAGAAANAPSRATPTPHDNHRVAGSTSTNAQRALRVRARRAACCLWARRVSQPVSSCTTGCGHHVCAPC